LTGALGVETLIGLETGVLDIVDDDCKLLV
jgi:hypothetical protein